MPLYKREGSPFWQYSFSVNGVRFRGSTGCAGKREAQFVEAEKLQEAKQKRTHKDPWRLRDCLGAYWSEKAKHKRSSTTTFTKLEALSRILGPDTLVTDITNAKLMDYRRERKKEGLQAHSVNRDFAYLRAAFRHAQEMHQQAIPPLAWKELKVSEPPNRIRFLSQDEYARLVSCCSPELSLIVKIAVATGLRKDNLLKLDWKEVDLSSKRITVTIKGNKRHSVRMSPPVRAALSTLPHRKGPVFDTMNFRRQWYRAVKDAGLTDFRFHDLRHTFASWARMGGADLADICEALGHSSVSVTMRYAHIEPEKHVTAFDRISDRVWSQKKTHRKAK